MIAEEVGGERGVDLGYLIEVTEPGMQCELGYIHSAVPARWVSLPQVDAGTFAWSEVPQRPDPKRSRDANDDPRP